MGGERERLRSLDHLMAKCAFCHDQCMSATAEVVVCGRQDLVVSRRATLVREVAAGRRGWTAALSDAVFAGVNAGRQSRYCIYGAEHRIEPYIRAARSDAIANGFVPQSVEKVVQAVAASGNVLGVRADAGWFRRGRGGPVLLTEVACRHLAGTAVEATLALLDSVGPEAAHVGVNSTGYVEFDLGFVEQARAAAAETATLLAGLGDQPLVSINPFTVAAFRLYAKELGLPLVSRVYTLVEFLATFGCPPVKRPIEGIGVYHDPGVLARDLGVVREPRSLLGAIGLELREAATYGENAADDGAHVGYPWSDVNERIALGRAEELLTTGARLVITASPWSLHNLSAVCGSVPVLDISEVLALASDLCSGRGVIG